MIINKIETIGLRYTEPNDFYSTRHTLLVRMETADGHVGWGEGVAMWPEAIRGVKTLIDSGLADVVLGESPLESKAIWLKLKQHTWWYGEGGLVSFAISALDMAIWDLKGKLLGQPLYRLLGGKCQGKLPACASIHVRHEAHSDNADEIKGYMEQGYQSVKVGFGKKGHAKLGQDANYDLSFVREVRHAIGDERGFMIDVGNNVRWDVAHAIRMTKAFQEYNLLWIEEPFYPDRWEAYRQLKQATDTLIATGEREWTVQGYRRLMHSGTVDVVGVDPARAEGITGFLKVIEMAEAERLTFNAHAWSTAIATAASLHLSVSSQNCLLFELKPLSNPMQHELVSNPIGQIDGWVVPSEEPGLGVDVDEEVVRKYRFI